MEKIHTYDKILSPIVTEKSTSLSVQNKIVFKVPNKSNKSILKAIVTLKKGQSIDLTTGI